MVVSLFADVVLGPAHAYSTLTPTPRPRSLHYNAPMPLNSTKQRGGSDVPTVSNSSSSRSDNTTPCASVVRVCPREMAHADKLAIHDTVARTNRRYDSVVLACSYAARERSVDASSVGGRSFARNSV